MFKKTFSVVTILILISSLTTLSFSEEIPTNYNLLKNSSFESFSEGQDKAPDGWSISKLKVMRNKENKKFDTYSAKLTYKNQEGILSQTISEVNNLKGKTLTFGCWVKASTPNQVHISLADGVSVTSSSSHTGSGDFEFLSVTTTISDLATNLKIAINLDASGSVYVDGSCLYALISEATYIPTSQDDLKMPSSLIYTDLDNQFLGIATSKPKLRLDVNGPIRSLGIYSSPPNSGTGLELLYDTSLNSGLIQVYEHTTSSHTLKDLYLQNQKFLFGADGRLEVQGDIKATGTIIKGDNEVITQKEANNWYVNVDGDTMTKDLTVQGNIHATGNLLVDGSVSATKFLGDGSGLTNLPLLWNQSGNDIYYTQGNIGIGTTNPQAKLDVLGTFKLASPTDTGYADHFLRIGSAYQLEGIANDSGGYVLEQQFGLNGYDGHMIFGTFYHPVLAFEDQNVAIGMRNTDTKLGVSGPVSIGTGDPLGLLHIAGVSPSFYLNDTGQTPSKMNFNQDAGALRIRNDYNIVAEFPSGTSGDITFNRGTQAGNVIVENGNVGIGTSTPSTKLDVNGPARFGAYTKASLPAADAAGRLARVTDEVRGLWMDQGNQWFSLSGEIINVKEFGAKADGMTDDGLAIQAAIDVLSSLGGGVVFFPKGAYKLGGTITIKSNVAIVGAGSSNTKFDISNLSNAVAFETETVTETALTWTNDIKIGDVLNDISSAPSVGDFIYFVANGDIGSLWGGVAGSNAGEIFKIKSKSATLLSFHTPAVLALSTSGGTCKYFTPNKNITLRGFGIIMKQDTALSVGIRLKHVDGAVLDDILVENSNQAGISIEFSMNVSGTDIKVKGGTPDAGYNYGIVFSNGCKHVNITNFSAENCRHGLAGGGSPTPMYCHVSNITVTKSQSNSLDTHGGTYGFVYDNADVDNGITISGMSHRIKNIVSSSGNFDMYAGGMDTVFEGIYYSKCSGINCAYNQRRITFRDIELNCYNLNQEVNRLGLGPDCKLLNFRIINKSFDSATNNSQADGTLPSISNGFCGLVLGSSNILENVYVYGFTVGVYLAQRDSRISGLVLENCGWDTSHSLPDSALLLATSSKGSYLEDVTITYTSTAVTNNSIAAAVRLDSELGGSDTADRITLKNMKHSALHTQNYATGLSVESVYKKLIIEDLKLNGIDYFQGSGRILNTSIPFTVAPSVGTWERGDVVWRTDPVAEQTPGWVCVSAGTPGTWKAMAELTN